MNAGVGAVVIGGDYQGLGVVRSLGRRGIPVCVIDDERSIPRYSHYATYAVRVDNVRDQRQTVEVVLDVGRRFGLDGRRSALDGARHDTARLVPGGS